MWWIALLGIIVIISSMSIPVILDYGAERKNKGDDDDVK